MLECSFSMHTHDQMYIMRDAHTHDRTHTNVTFAQMVLVLGRGTYESCDTVQHDTHKRHMIGRRTIDRKVKHRVRTSDIRAIDGQYCQSRKALQNMHKNTFPNWDRDLLHKNDLKQLEFCT